MSGYPYLRRATCALLFGKFQCVFTTGQQSGNPVSKIPKHRGGFPIPDGRRLMRVALKRRASLVAKLGRQETRIPCLILDSSQVGFRLRGTVRLRRGQVVEVILDENPLDQVRCSVVWVGEPGSQHEGEAGLVAIPDSLNMKPVGSSPYH
jgi:hypothetical protein